METGLKHLHSLLAYLTVILLVISVVNALIGLIGKRPFKAKDVRIPLFTLIVTHFQVLVGIILFFFSPMVQWFNKNTETSAIMKNPELRLYNLEHPLVMIIAVILITIGFSRHKNKLSPKSKFKTIFIFYTIALVLVLSRIPWQNWF